MPDDGLDYLAVRKGMGSGPWDDEPDRMEWRHRGVPCLIVRNHSGVLCGYAACNPGHTWHGADFESVAAGAHGGLTFSGRCSGEICHVPLAGEPDDVWWLGFDCGHYRDLCPTTEETLRLATGPRYVPPEQKGRIYRDIAFVKAECERLAEQILEEA